MTLEDTLDRCAKEARERHEESVKDGDRNGRPLILGWRADQLVLMAIPKDVDRDQGLTACYLAAVGFGCDTLAMTTDGWYATTLTNPITGKDWGPREMQQIVTEHRGLETGVITEALTTIVVNRAGDIRARAMRYVVHEKTNDFNITTRTIEWTRSIDDGDLKQFGGYVPDEMIRFMTSPSAQQWTARVGLNPWDFGLTNEEALAHTDCGALKAIVSLGQFEGLLMLTADTEARKAVLDKSLRGYDGGWTTAPPRPARPE